MNKRTEKTSEAFFRLDCFLACHQRLCWICAAALTVTAAFLVVRFALGQTGMYWTVGLALLIMAGYAWMGRAPISRNCFGSSPPRRVPDPPARTTP